MLSSYKNAVVFYANLARREREIELENERKKPARELARENRGKKRRNETKNATVFQDSIKLFQSAS